MRRGHSNSWRDIQAGTTRVAPLTAQHGGTVVAQSCNRCPASANCQCQLLFSAALAPPPPSATVSLRDWFNVNPPPPPPLPHSATTPHIIPQLVPFLLESRLREQGARFESAKENWAPHVVADHKLVTGEAGGVIARSKEGSGRKRGPDRVCLCVGVLCL